MTTSVSRPFASRPFTRRSVLLGAGVASLGLSAPHIARAAVRVVRFGHNNATNSHYGLGAQAFADAVAADTGLSAALRIEVHPNAELGDELGMLKNCAKGTLDGMVCSGSVLSNVVPEVGLFNAPFLFADVAHARAALDGPVGAEFMVLAQEKELRVLAWGENGLRQITANKPVRSPADIKGLKLRVPQSAVMLEGMRALGADAAPLSFNLLRDALRSGQFEGQENAVVTIETAKLWDVQKCISMTGHIYDPASVLASSDLMEDLTDAQRTALVACARAGANVMRTVADAAQRDGIARLRTAGMVVVEDIDGAAFRAAARPFLDRLSGQFGTERMQRVLAVSA